MERTFAWLNQYRRLRVRYDKRADIHEAFLSVSGVRGSAGSPCEPHDLTAGIYVSPNVSSRAPHRVNAADVPLHWLESLQF